MGLDKTNICNMALAHIKQRTINAITDQSEQARKCALYYDPMRRAVLRACDWNFAYDLTQGGLTLLGSWANVANAASGGIPLDSNKNPVDVLPEWNYLYAQPKTCIRVRRIYNPFYPSSPSPWLDRTWEQRSQWRSWSKYKAIGKSPVSGIPAIASNLQSAYCEFTFDALDESKFDDMFVEAFSLALAARLSLPLSADKELKAQVIYEYNIVMGEAKRKNGGEGTEELSHTSFYEQARDGYEELWDGR